MPSTEAIVGIAILITLAGLIALLRRLSKALARKKTAPAVLPEQFELGAEVLIMVEPETPHGLSALSRQNKKAGRGERKRGQRPPRNDQSHRMRNTGNNRQRQTHRVQGR